jgi:integrase
MAKGKIIKTAVDALEPKRRADGSLADAFLWDEQLKGFGVKATPGGKKVFIVQYCIGGRAGKDQRLTLGVHGSITADQARKMALAELGKIAAGQDPAAARRSEKRKLAAETFKDIAEAYLANHAKGTRYWKEKRARLASADLDAIRARPICTITRARLSDVIETVKARSHAAALHLFSDIRPIFAWALNRGSIEVNPMAGMRGPAPLDDRKRTLSHDEIRALWKATDALDYPWAPFYRLLLLTAQRRVEVAGMRWTEIDLEEGIWNLPPERTKNGAAHTVDLGPQALAILNALPNSRAGFVLTTTGTVPISGYSKIKARLDILMAAELGGELKPWRNHDLRRTAASGMRGLRIPADVIERVLNHLSGEQGGLQGIYQRHELIGERREALFRWGEHVEKLTSG